LWQNTKSKERSNSVAGPDRFCGYWHFTRSLDA
jgi:hypothetical protein